MSDLDNELLALAGGNIPRASPSSAPQNSNGHHGSSKRGRKPGNSSGKSKRRKKMEMDSESDMDMSSGSEAGLNMDDSDSEGNGKRSSTANPYPYEGIYKDYADKQRIQNMSELDREAILGDRQDELQKIRDRENIKNMVRAREEETGKRSSGREKNRTGTTLEKAQKLDELKQKRQAKERRPKMEDPDLSHARRKRVEDMNWEEESEDGEIDAVEEQALAREERATRKMDENATLEDIRSVLLTRRRASQLCYASFFADYVKGMWVRVSVGCSKDDPKREVKYRAGEVKHVVEHDKYYEVEGQATKVALVVLLAKAEKTVLLDVVSNSTIQESEWMFVVGECRRNNVRIPTKKEIGRKLKLIDKYADWVKDESHISAQVKAKKEMKAQTEGPTVLSITERVRLESERDQAHVMGNMELYEQLNKQLEQATRFVVKPDNNLMSELNERNRRANREEIRKAELAAAEVRRQQMRAIETGAAVKIDPSARVKINPKLTYEVNRTPVRPSASHTGTGNSTPASSQSTSAAITAAKAKGPPTRFEEMVAAQVHVDIDIADF